MRLVKSLLVALVLLGSAYAGTVQQFAEAIAQAEGFFRAGTIPNRYHNPGDLKARASHQYPGQVRLGKANHVVFKNDSAGWAALENQIQRIIDGTSRWYTPEMTIDQIAKRYAGHYRIWAKNVRNVLGVDRETTLCEYLGLPPRVEYPLDLDSILKFVPCVST